MDRKEKTATCAIPQTEGCTISGLIGQETARNPGLSGFHIFETGEESLDGRLHLIQAAEKSLDLQYYAVSEGISSNVLIEALLQAAERNVRIRFLVDDITTGDMRRSLLALDEIENLEVRVFNPINKSDQSFAARLLAAFLHKDRATRRMHNKALIADNQMAIIGGRNLGDEYFDTHKEMSFKDIDVIAAGPVVDEISQSFDEFWNDDHTFPVLHIHHARASDHAIEQIRANLKKNWRKFFHRTQKGRRIGTSMNAGIDCLIEKLVWAKGDLIADKSSKITDRQSYSPPLRRLKEIVDQAKSEFIIISAYFVPGEDGVSWLTSLCERGMRLKILTNSLASTDVVAVHTGYRTCRVPLLKKGVSLFELKPRGDKRTRQRLIARKAPSFASIHAKAYIVDHKYAVIGSFNFDPRSAYLNTELGLFIESETLAMRLRQMFEESSSPEASYRLGLAPGNKLVWASREDGGDIRYVTEPEASVWRKLQVFLISMLPVEEQL